MRRLGWDSTTPSPSGFPARVRTLTSPIQEVPSSTAQWALKFRHTARFIELHGVLKCPSPNVSSWAESEAQPKDPYPVFLTQTSGNSPYALEYSTGNNRGCPTLARFLRKGGIPRQFIPRGLSRAPISGHGRSKGFSPMDLAGESSSNFLKGMMAKTTLKTPCSSRE